MVTQGKIKWYNGKNALLILLFMNKWFFAAVLALGAHFCASYLVPLDQKAQQTFLGLLRWAWPWADGDHGPLGVMTVSHGFPVAGFFIAVTAGGMLILAALAVVGWWVPFSWWRVCAIVGAALSLFLMIMFFSPTKLIPIVFDIFILWAAWTNWPATAIHS
jgi:hypothetical protein